MPHAIKKRTAVPKLSGSTQFQAKAPEPNQDATVPIIINTLRHLPASELLIFSFYLV
jgi:predicted secreted protein